jgi:hypothetical protein
LGQGSGKSLKYLGFSGVMGGLHGCPFPRQGGISSEGQDKEAVAQLQAPYPTPFAEEAVAGATATDVQG